MIDNADDRTTFDLFARRFDAINREIPGRPPLSTPVAVRARARRPASWIAGATVVAVLIMAGLGIATLQSVPHQGGHASASPPVVVGGASVSPSSSPASTVTPSPSISCGRISADDCELAVTLVRTAHPAELADARWIVVDDSCPPPAVCDRAFAFDAVVVLVSPSGESLAYRVVGTRGPERVMPGSSAVPQHIATFLPDLVSPSSTVTVGDWSARCVEVAEADCIGAVERYVNLLARSTASVLAQSGGVLTVTSRPVCPPVQAWADGSSCWQVTALDVRLPSTGEPWCMVIARRAADVRYPPYVSVGGPDGTGRAGGMPAGWPSCN